MTDSRGIYQGDTSDSDQLDRRAPRRAVALCALKIFGATVSGAEQALARWHTSNTFDTTISAESSTAIHDLSNELRLKLDLMLDSAVHEFIEDGYDNSIKRNLRELLLRDCQAILPALSSMIESSGVSPVIAAEILKELGRIDEASSHTDRRWLLARSLRAKSIYVRDGAALGLARLADPTTISLLHRAIHDEPNAEIREDLQLVLDEISETSKNGSATTEGHY